MIAVGLTGSIAMGKSEVARIFRSAGYPVFDSDREVHGLYESPEGVELVRPFAPQAVSDGKVDRAALSKIALEDPQLLGRLEPVIHAEIRRRQVAFLDAAKKYGHALAVIDVPLLYETGGDVNVDVVIVVSSPSDLQRTRALSRPGMTRDKLAMILARQMPDAEKRKRADLVIVNDQGLAELEVKTRHLIAALVQGNQH